MFISPNLRLSLALGSLLLMAASIGNAYSFGEPIRVLHLSPLLGYRWGGSFKNSDTGNSFDMDASPAYGLMLEHHPRGSWHKLQFGWTRQESQLSISNGGISQDRDVTVDYYHVGMQVEVPYGEHLFMTTTATIGASSFSVQNEGNDTHFLAALEQALNISLAIRNASPCAATYGATQLLSSPTHHQPPPRQIPSKSPVSTWTMSSGNWKPRSA